MAQSSLRKLEEAVMGFTAFIVIITVALENRTTEIVNVRRSST